MPSPNSRRRYTYQHRGWTFPTLGYVLEVHGGTIEASGGLPGVKDEGLVISAVQAPVETAGGEDAYYRLTDKVAALGFRLARSHGFTDGNKRTALMTMQITLEWQGFYLTGWTPETSVLVMSLLGAGHLGLDGLKHALVLGCELDPTDPNLP